MYSPSTFTVSFLSSRRKVNVSLALLPLQIAAGGAVYLLGSVAFRLESFTYLFDILKRRLPAR